MPAPTTLTAPRSPTSVTRSPKRCGHLGADARFLVEILAGNHQRQSSVAALVHLLAGDGVLIEKGEQLVQRNPFRWRVTLRPAAGAR